MDQTGSKRMSQRGRWESSGHGAQPGREGFLGRTAVGHVCPVRGEGRQRLDWLALRPWALGDQTLPLPAASRPPHMSAEMQGRTR